MRRSRIEEEEPEEQAGLRVLWGNILTIALALLVAMAIRCVVVQPFRIPTGSMQPTLATGDYIVVTKWSYGLSRYSFAPFERFFGHGRFLARTPERGEIIVFRPPTAPDTVFVKRLIGLPGDRIRVIDGRLYINGRPVERRSLGLTVFTDAAGRQEALQTYEETLPNGVRYRTFDRDPYNANDNTREFVVPAGNYFFMGDDRDISQDSRSAQVGAVPFENLIGPARFVLASFDSTAVLWRPWSLVDGFRGERFLLDLRRPPP